MGELDELDVKFTPLFALREDGDTARSEREALARPDARSGDVYCMTPTLHLAVEVALTTGRPLLLRGDPGTGKSSLAPYVARRLGWRYYEHVVTSTSTASDLLWRFDAIRRLADAQANALEPEATYIEPSVLWWALDPASASSYGIDPMAASNEKRDPHRAVALIDEIDKAHPDLPNGLLVALGSNQFVVPQLGRAIELSSEEPKRLDLPDGVEVSRLLVVITTNEERELPAAFLRRCVSHRLDHPRPAGLVRIARAHFSRPDAPFDAQDESLAMAIAKRVEDLRRGVQPGEHKPSTAEFLDAFRACRRRGIKPDSSDRTWATIERVTLAKPGLEGAS